MAKQPVGEMTFPILGSSQPIRGMRSSSDRATLGPGFFPLLKECRSDDGLFKVRNGQAAVLVKPTWAISDYPLGGGWFKLNDQDYLVEAWSDGSRGRITVSTDLVRRVEVTGTNQWTGPSGNNRLTDITSPVTMAAASLPAQTARPDNSKRDILFIQNGTDFPRVFDPGIANVNLLRVINAVANVGGEFELTTTVNHQYSTGDHVYIRALGGLPQLDGLWQIAVTAVNKFTLTGSTFVAGYSGSGQANQKIDLGVIQPLTFPENIGVAYATWDAGFQVAGTVGKTYFAAAGPPKVNQANFSLANTSVAPYNNSNTAILFTIGTGVAAGDVATVQFASDCTFTSQMHIVVEGASFDAIFKQLMLRGNPSNVAYNLINPATAPWVTVYDPSANNETSNFTKTLMPTGTGGTQQWLISFDMPEIATFRHIELTRIGSAPAAAQSLNILFIGSTAGDVPATAKWALTYESVECKSEGRGYAARINNDPISRFGGVSVVKDGSNTAESPKFPLDPKLIASWRMVTRNTTGAATVSGGLQSQPNQVVWYVNTIGNTDSFFTKYQATDYKLADIDTIYAPTISGTTKQWTKSGTDGSREHLCGARLSTLCLARYATSEFQVPMPIARVVKGGNNRIACGNVIDSSGVSGPGNVYFSWAGNPTRFGELSDLSSEISVLETGTSLAFPGESVTQIYIGDATTVGYGVFLAFTNKKAYELGQPSINSFAFNTAADLSTPRELGAFGTRSPLSVVGGNGYVLWLDQDAQWTRYEGRGTKPFNLGYQRIDDRLNSLNSALLSRVSAVHRSNRVYMGGAVASATDNTRCWVWSEYMKEVESEDYPAKNFEMAFIWGGEGVTRNRVFTYNSDGTLYAYEENAIDDAGIPIVPAFETRMLANGIQCLTLTDAYMMITARAATNWTIDRISRAYGSSKPWTNTLPIFRTNDPDATIVRMISSYLQTHPTVTGSSGRVNESEWYLSITGPHTPGATIYEFFVNAVASDTPSYARN